MAIDTATKRASTVACGLGFLLVLPVPDGAIGTTDRPHACDLYAMAADAPVAEEAPRRPRVGQLGGSRAIELGGTRILQLGGSRAHLPT